MNGRPAYICHFVEPKLKVMYADDGALANPLRHEAVRRLVRRETDETIEAVVEVDYDQWTVHQKFDAHRPLYRIELANSGGARISIFRREPANSSNARRHHSGFGIILGLCRIGSIRPCFERIGLCGTLWFGGFRCLEY